MRRSSWLLGLLVASQAGCMRTAVMPPQQTDYLIVHTPSTALVTPVGGDPIKVERPRVVSGWLVGWSKGEPVSMRVDQVQGVKVRQLNPLPTSLITGAVLVTGGAIVAWRLTKPKSKTDCAYEAAVTQGDNQFEADELGALGQCVN
jgi:hypothetical protein